jgi:hypothetical protein
VAWTCGFCDKPLKRTDDGTVVHVRAEDEAARRRCRDCGQPMKIVNRPGWGQEAAHVRHRDEVACRQLAKQRSLLKWLKGERR